MRQVIPGGRRDRVRGDDGSAPRKQIRARIDPAFAHRDGREAVERAELHVGQPLRLVEHLMKTLARRGQFAGVEIDDGQVRD